jgi:hypothetical protein
MRLPAPPERRVLLLQRAAVALYGPEQSVAYLHTFCPALGTTPAAAAWLGGNIGEAAEAQLHTASQLLVSTRGKRA